MKAGGIFNGTGADVVLCVGFIPDWVRVWNLEGTQRILLEWNRLMARSAEIVDGIQLTAADQTAAALTTGNGVKIHDGGVVLTTTLAGTVTYGEGVYLKRDIRDYRYYSGNSPHGLGDAVSADVTGWTLDTAGSHTGHFNNQVNGTYIGEGSVIVIDGKTYSIVGLTSNGEAADEVTLDRDAPAGDIQFISGMYDYCPMVANETTKEGFLISNTTVNVNDALMAFECGTYDR